MKTCSKCNIEKDESEFHKSIGNKDGLCGRCKNCKKIEDKEYSKTEKYKTYQRNWQREYLKTEKKKEYVKQYIKSESFKIIQKKYCKSEKGRDRKSNICNILNLTKEERKNINPEIIELKRIQMKIVRKLKEIENANQQH